MNRKNLVSPCDITLALFCSKKQDLLMALFFLHPPMMVNYTFLIFFSPFLDQTLGYLDCLVQILGLEKVEACSNYMYEICCEHPIHLYSVLGYIQDPFPQRLRVITSSSLSDSWVSDDKILVPLISPSPPFLDVREEVLVTSNSPSEAQVIDSTLNCVFDQIPLVPSTPPLESCIVEPCTSIDFLIAR